MGENMKKTIEDVVRITYERAKKEIAHPVYPQHEDLAQDCLKNWVARRYKNPKTTTHYTLLNKFNRETLPALDRSYNEVELDDFHSEQSTSQKKQLHREMYVQDFLDWLPEGRNKDMIYRNSVIGEDMTEIAESYGVTRQALHHAKTKLIVKYQLEKGILK